MEPCQRSIEHYMCRSFRQEDVKPTERLDTMNKVQERKKAKQVLNISKTRVAKSKAQLQYTMYGSTHGSKAKHSIRSDKRNYIFYNNWQPKQKPPVKVI